MENNASGNNNDFLTALKSFFGFEKMITPVLIKVMYFLMLICTIGGGVIVMVNGSIVGGFATLTLGTIMVRVWCELMLVIFEILKNLQQINHKLKN